MLGAYNRQGLVEKSRESSEAIHIAYWGMTMNIADALRKYKEKTARIAMLELEIDGLRDELKHSTGIHETDEETIEGMAYRRVMVEGHSSETSSKTERVALTYKEEQERLKQPKSISHINAEIRKREAEKKRLEDETIPIKIALDGLNAREKLIVEEFYINGNSWYMVSVVHQQRYGQYIVEDTCKKIRNRAFKKMRRIIMGVK